MKLSGTIKKINDWSLHSVINVCSVNSMILGARLESKRQKTKSNVD
jgi:hypothetical protein